jgi:hypothetical protein
MKLPRWDCRNEADRKHLEEWTLDQLRKLDNELDKLNDQLVTERDIEMMEAMQSDYFFKWSEEQFKRDQQRARVIQAVKAKDTRLLLRLTANDPELQQLWLLTLKRRGRPKGSRKTDIVGKKRIISADIVGEEREVLEYADADVPRIYDLWQRQLGHRNRKESPTAVEIAARRWGVGVAKLRKFRKNFSVLTR